MAGLVERRNQETRRSLIHHGMRLFAANGFDETSMEDVARAAGVSRRTAYRHFASKEDVVLAPVADWFAILGRVVADRGPTEPTRDLCRRAHMAIAASIDADPDPVLRAYGVVAASQRLQNRQGKTNAEWVAFYAELVMADTGTQPFQALAAHVCGWSLIASTSAMFPVWLASGGELAMTELTASVLDQIDSVWPDATRVAPKPAAT